MLFSEVYSAYYNAVAKLINAAVDGSLTVKNANEYINSSAFHESFVYILEAIKNEDWPLITKDCRTPIRHHAEMPLTDLQLRFLKTISLDKRFRLFCDENILGLEGIEPLYYFNEDFHVFDIIADGDPFENENYILNFKKVLSALQEKRNMRIQFDSGNDKSHNGVYTPRKLEYSEKDDKFRLLCLGSYQLSMINLGRIKSCSLLDKFDESAVKALTRHKEQIILTITDERNALERCMLQFANYEKEAKKIDDIHYEMKLTYYKEDETEILIRVLSFGPKILVTSPDSFISLIKERLYRQKKLRQI